MKFTVLMMGLCICVAAPSWAATTIGTGPGGTPSPAQAAKQAAQAASGSLIYVPVSEAQSAGGAGTQAVPAATFTAIDVPKTLTCPGPNTCRIQATVWASLFNGSTATNRFGLCGYLDGVLMTQPGGGSAGFGCPFNGIVPADGSVIGATQITAQSQIPPGQHTVQFQAYVTGGATIGLYLADYRLYSVQRATQ